MDTIVIEILEYHPESFKIDFKKTQYPIEDHAKKNEILKDISAMANHLSEEDKFIIIGVKAKNGITNEFLNIESLIDQAKYQQFINDNIEPSINFEYKSFIYKDFQLAYFRIFNNKQRPYLFKRDVQNSVLGDKTEYKKGDGFIRSGTSNKKIDRNDLEMIYKARYKTIDRRSDIKVTPHLNECEEANFKEIGIKCFDVTIENVSNHSINLDAKVIIKKSDDYNIIPRHEFENELARRNSDRYTPYIPNINPIIFNLDIKQSNATFSVECVKLRTEDSAIHIAQNDVEEDIFNREILIFSERSFNLEGEIILRSDDFSEGFLRIPFKLNN